jgi:hypothetical protein
MQMYYTGLNECGVAETLLGNIQGIPGSVHCGNDSFPSDYSLLSQSYSGNFYVTRISQSFAEPSF